MLLRSLRLPVHANEGEKITEVGWINTRLGLGGDPPSHFWCGWYKNGSVNGHSVKISPSASV
jgi:hypothetical protein